MEYAPSRLFMDAVAKTNRTDDSSWQEGKDSFYQNPIQCEEHDSSTPYLQVLQIESNMYGNDSAGKVFTTLLTICLWRAFANKKGNERAIGH
mmetsp:Transcript_1610/g.2427  ORF Transcript_1610/g.2427 Transcript_1610/m.2427 type:complete len:92 (-) Transcript_1610:159-434(-)